MKSNTKDTDDCWVLYSYDVLWDNPDHVGIRSVHSTKEEAMIGLADHYRADQYASEDGLVRARYYVDCLEVNLTPDKS